MLAEYRLKCQSSVNQEATDFSRHVDWHSVRMLANSANGYLADRYLKCSFKGGDKSLKDNYRPISILPTLSKIIERSAYVQLWTYLEQNKLLSQSQFGFCQKRSTSTALVKFTDQILENMGKGCITGAVFLDSRRLILLITWSLLTSSRV